MKTIENYRGWGLGLLGAMALALNGLAIAADHAGELMAEARGLNRSIELFEALSQSLVETRFIPQSAAQAVVYLKSTTDVPLDIQLPQAFGAVHVLAQVGGGVFGGGGGGLGGPGGLAQGGLAQGGLGQAGGGQGLGGGFGGGGGLNAAALNGGGLGAGGLGGGRINAGGGLAGGGFFRIEPGKTRKLLVHTICLEHGKPDPNPRMTYQLVPLEKVNSDEAIRKLCQVLGQGKVSQSVAQAAAWHLANGLTWEELRLKNRHESKYTGHVRWFSGTEIESAWELSQLCQQAAGSSAMLIRSLSDVQTPPVR